MDLAEKLDRLKRQKTDQLLKQLGGQLMRASQLPEQATEPAFSSPEEIFADGERVENEFGHLFVRRVELTPAEPRHPRGYSFPAFASSPFADPQTIRRLARDPEAEIDLSSWVSLDVETTGLAGGTGTYPFLIGVGWFEGENFVVEQYFMEDYPCELALMHHLRERLSDFEGLITYNGKSFDIPLLRTRFIYNRIPSAFELPHWDLLHTARRLWRRRLPSCTLDEVERSILGCGQREHDIHGSEIPRLYFDYVRGRRRERMILVFDHNVQDICSLGALAVRTAEYYRNPDHPDLRYAADLTGLAGIMELNQEHERAMECLEKALLYERSPEASHRLSLHIARRYKRRGRWTEAEAVWRAQLSAGQPHSVEAHVELAKYLEHQRRDHPAAEKIVREAVRRLEGRAELQQYVEGLAPSTLNSEDMAALLHRLARLERKIAGAQTKKPQPESNPVTE